MNTDQDIIQYLSSFNTDELMTSSALHSEINGLIEKIEAHKLKQQELTAQQINKLSVYRLMSSNTLNKQPKEEDLNRWTKAQNLIFTKMTLTQDFLDENDIQEVNMALTGKGSSEFRDYEMRGADGEYLSAAYVKEMITAYLQTLTKFTHPLRIAFETYLNIVNIHPFENANGRTARLCGDFYLLKNEYLPCCFLNSYHSHVALLKNEIPKSKDQSFVKYLEAIVRSYHLIESWAVLKGLYFCGPTFR